VLVQLASDDAMGGPQMSRQEVIGQVVTDEVDDRGFRMQ
jgi:hypothetical protein